MRRGAAVVVAVAVVLRCASPAFACAVCFGDPESPLTKGALMGVYVLVGVVGFVLVGIAGTGAFWIQRSRKLARRGDWDTTDPR